jgi:hypothetical protein
VSASTYPPASPSLVYQDRGDTTLALNYQSFSARSASSFGTSPLPMMEAYSSSSKLDLSGSANSLLHSHSHSTSSVESSPQSSGTGDIKRKTCGGNNLIPTSVTGLTSDLSSLYALENLHHHHSSLPHHSHSSHSGLLVGGSSSSSIITPSTSSSQSIQSGSAGSLIAAGSTLGLPG